MAWISSLDGALKGTSDGGFLNCFESRIALGELKTRKITIKLIYFKISSSEGVIVHLVISLVIATNMLSKMTLPFEG
ncbi:acetyl-CoA acetyltransferase [Vibrio alginolyticus]|nr:acetyl-CoA acetyltransferase [Vibrio alginolyticus]